ncbi:hypothetical protein H6F94_10230 [Leptolyngbya sp. FACHB-261]|nr:hypothetical protein [Leptolyngbya sp. FACHB-261]
MDRLPALLPVYVLVISLVVLAQLPASAQRLNAQEAATLAYQALPQLPREDQYSRVAGAQRDAGSTLLQRLIRYHQLSKSRSLYYRLDWKLTLADYLGSNEVINEDIYPGADTLTRNPLEGDRAAIRRLSRAQRNQLVQTLTEIFTQADGRTISPAGAASTGPSTGGTTGPANGSSSSSQPNRPPQPRPGDARLLLGP